jgi:hypothetical protein
MTGVTSEARTAQLSGASEITFISEEQTIQRSEEQTIQRSEEQTIQ